MARTYGADDLGLLHTYLGSMSVSLKRVKRRLLFLTLPGTTDNDTLLLLSRSLQTVSTARLICAPGRGARFSHDGGQEEEYVSKLMDASESLVSQGTLLRDTWETLFERTDKRQPNALALAFCFTRDATERFCVETERFVEKVLHLQREVFEPTYGSVERGSRSMGMSRLWNKQHVIRRARERAQDMGPLARVHPARRQALRKAMDRAKEKREMTMSRRKMMMIGTGL
jgi:hypothetical protein